MAEGTVRWFSEKIGFGFIEMEDGQDIFVHHSDLDASGFKGLDEGDRVMFDIVRREKGLAATNLAHR